MTSTWGIHNDTLTSELVDDGFVSVGWDELGDLREIGLDRDSLRAKLTATFPSKKPRAIAAWTGILHRFAEEIVEGDVVVAPYKPDSTINIGVVTGPYHYVEGARTHRHRRPVTWKKVGVPRSVFSQPALYELGAFLAVFGIRKHAKEFLAAMDAAPDSVEVATQAIEEATLSEDAESVDEPRASRIDRHTRDFVLERLKSDITHQEFEDFTADLLRAMGYEARVTSYTQDGGVDVIAHRDPLGIEPPLIKVQCKHQAGTIGAPDVQRLVGSQSAKELGLFVTLGNYSRDAVSIERTREGLRLISGEDLVDLVLRHYADLAQGWRSRIPLTSLLVVDDSADL
jgi:restriction system protein